MALVISFCGNTFAEARAMKCDGVFQPTVKDVIDRMNEENGQFMFKGKSFEDFSQNQSWLRRRKIRKLIQALEIRSVPSEKALDRYAIELGTLLFGQKEIVDRWIFQNKEQRLEESALIIIKEQLLKEGLLKTWGDVNNPSQIGIIKKSLDRIWTFQNSRVGELLKLPFALPSIKDQAISKELMYKVIRDGFEAHADEVRIALKHQNKIEAYNTFKKLYSPVFMGVMLISHMMQAYEDIKRQQEIQLAETLKALREQREAIETNIPQVKQEILETAYKSAEAEFITKWGEPPTAEEASQLKAKIAEALNMN
jgi:ribosomal protein L29